MICCTFLISKYWNLKYDLDEKPSQTKTTIGGKKVTPEEDEDKMLDGKHLICFKGTVYLTFLNVGHPEIFV